MKCISVLAPGRSFIGLYCQRPDTEGTYVCAMVNGSTVLLCSSVKFKLLLSVVRALADSILHHVLVALEILYSKTTRRQHILYQDDQLVAMELASFQWLRISAGTVVALVIGFRRHSLCFALLCVCLAECKKCPTKTCVSLSCG